MHMYLTVGTNLKTCAARQMIMFSATWPLDVHNLAEEYMDPNPVKVWLFAYHSITYLLFAICSKI